MKRQLDDEGEFLLDEETFDFKQSKVAEDEAAKVISESTFTAEMEALDEELKSRCQCNPYSPFTHAGPFVLGQQLSDAQFIDLDQFVARRAVSDSSKDDDPNHYYMLKIVTLPWSKEEESYSQRQAKLLIYNEYSVLSMLRDQSGVIHLHGLYMDYFYDDEALGGGSGGKTSNGLKQPQPSSGAASQQRSSQATPPTTSYHNPMQAQAQPPLPPPSPLTPQQARDQKEATKIRGMLVVGPKSIMNSHPASSTILASTIRNSPLGVNWGKQKEKEGQEKEQSDDGATQSADGGGKERQSSLEDGGGSSANTTTTATATVNSSSFPVNCPRRGKLMRRIILVLDCYIAHIYCSTVYPLPRLFSRFTTVNSEYENLQEYVKRYRIIPEMKTLLIMKRIVDIVHELHQRNIAHRDLRLENILFNHRDEKVILVNFGLARYVINDRICICDHRGSSAYISPDVLRRRPYNPKASDCWAMGIIFYTLLFGKFPFYAETFPELFSKINIGEYSLPPAVAVWMDSAEDQPTKTETCSMVIYHKTSTLISRLIVTDPNKRMTAGEFRRHLSLLIREKVLAKCQQEDKRLIASGKVRDDQLQVVPDVLHNRRRRGGRREESGRCDQDHFEHDNPVSVEEEEEEEEDDASRHLHDHNYFQSMQLTKTAISELIRKGEQGAAYYPTAVQHQFSNDSGVELVGTFASPSFAGHSHPLRPGPHWNAFCRYREARWQPSNFLRSYRAPSVYSPLTDRFYLRFGVSQYEDLQTGPASSCPSSATNTHTAYTGSSFLSEQQTAATATTSNRHHYQPSLLLSVIRPNKRHKSFSKSSAAAAAVAGSSAGGSGAGGAGGDSAADAAPYLRSPTFLRLGSKKMAQSAGVGGVGAGSGVGGPSFSAAAAAAAASSSRYTVIKVEGDVRPLSESEINLAKSFLSSQ